MCGIIGYIGEKDVDSVITAGLIRLEYRGYDSAGIATIYEGEIGIRKRVGKIKNLQDSLTTEPLRGHIGIGHTRWATHGEPTETNAHPHTDCDSKIAVVHNGIIENYYSLKEKLIKEGHVFKSETDTEVIPHMFEKYADGGLLASAFKIVKELEGAFAVCAVSEEEPERIIVIKKGSPIVLGVGKGENIIASDVTAILNLTRSYIILEDGEIAVVEKNKIAIYDFSGKELSKEVNTADWDESVAEKCGYENFMLKEIHEQPDVVRSILRRRIEGNAVEFHEQKISNQQLLRVNRVVIQACGTSWHAGLVGKYVMEKYAHLQTEVDISSEFRYRNPIVDGDTLVVAITQSGETADTIAGMREAKSKFVRVLSFCNREESTIARESDGTIYINAGCEIGVASTKAYTAQLMCIYLFTIFLGKLKWTISEKEAGTMIEELKTVANKIEEILQDEKTIIRIAEKYSNANNFLFLGRGINYPTALEGALKLKEISYIHATGYPAGEMKHGPIALIDENMPVICIAPAGSVYEKMMSNIQEVKSRKGKIIAIATKGDRNIESLADDVVFIPQISEELSPVLAVVPLQLIAYHVAVKRGCDVDKPRNLAKSVTVE